MIEKIMVDNGYLKSDNQHDMKTECTSCRLFSAYEATRLKDYKHLINKVVMHWKKFQRCKDSYSRNRKGKKNYQCEKVQNSEKWNEFI